MPDREKVINALGRCESYGYCEDKNCPYYGSVSCLELLRKDALELLKNREPRVMTLEEVINAKDKTDVWLDEPDYVVVAATISNWVESKNHAVTFFYGIEHTAFGERDYMNNNYNKKWRCWTSRPTPEQMRDTRWGGEKDA